TRHADSCRLRRRRSTSESGSGGVGFDGIISLLLAHAVVPERKTAGPGGARPHERSLVALVFLLLAGAADGRPQDVAEAGAGVRRAVLGHRLLVLVDLLGLDRQRDAARCAVDIGDLGIDLLA